MMCIVLETFFSQTSFVMINWAVYRTATQIGGCAIYVDSIYSSVAKTNHLHHLARKSKRTFRHSVAERIICIM